MVSDTGGRTRPSFRRRDLLAAAGPGVVTGLAGCGYIGNTTSDGRPLAGESIRIGVLAPMDSPEGDSLTRGAEMAAEQIEADGGIAGASVELVEGDVADGEDAAPTHDRLCGDADCDLTVGLLFGGHVRKALPSVAAHETVHLTTGAFDGRLGELVREDYDEYKYHFRAGLPDAEGIADAFGEFFETHVDDIGWETAAVYTDDLEGLRTYHDRLVGHAADYLDVPLHGRLSGLSGSYHGLFDDAEAEGCDVFLSSGRFHEASTIARQWAGSERPFALGGFDVSATRPDLWEETDGAVESTFAVNALTAESRNTAVTREFVAEYAERYGEFPMYTGALTYDALRHYGEAVESVLKDGDDELPSQDAIVEALETISFDDGVVYPSFEFTGPDADRVHEPVWESMAVSGVPVVQQWQRDGDGDGVVEAIAPQQNRTASYRPPPWLR